MSAKPRRQHARPTAKAKPSPSKAGRQPPKKARRPAVRTQGGDRRQRRERQHASVSGRRLWLFRLTAVVVGPVVFVCLVELSLRIAGYGYRPDVTVACEVNGDPSYGDNVKFGWRFFPPILAREFEPFVFPAEKPARTYRVFVLGASAAQGVPNNAFCFGRIVEVMLQERFGGTHFEVITAATAAINSHVVLEIAKDCARHQPDLFVVYLGNNEVVGPYGPGTILTPALSNLHLIRLGITMRKTRIGQLVAGLAPGRGLPEGRPEYWRGMEMFLGQQVRMDDTRLEAVYDHFQRNLKDICRVAADAGAATILCTVGVNLKDCPPFASLHRSGLTQEQQEDWEQVYRLGTEQESRGDYAEAVLSYLEAARIDDSFADLQFRLAQCYWQRGEYERAHDTFARARDLDALRFRADSRINEAIRTVAQRSQGVRLADVVASLEDGSGHGSPGELSFHEHVHLTFKGNYLLARTVFEQIEGLLADTLEGAARQGELPTEEQCAVRLAYNDWSHHTTLHTVVHSFLAKPPFTNQLYHQERVSLLQQRLDALKDRLTPETLRGIAKRYLAAIEKAPDDWRLHWDYGKLLAEDLKEYDAAATRYRIVQDLLPHSHMGHDALASVLRAKGDFAGAIAEYQKVLAIKPTAGEAHYYLGWCYQKQGKADAAVSYYRKAIRFSPDCIPAYLSLGEEFFRQGRLKEAAEVCRAGLVIAPGHSLLHSNLGMLLIKMGQRQEGRKEILTALQIDPNSPRIRKVAETLLGPPAIR